MVINVISVLILIALVVVFAWLTQRAWGARNAFLKWIGVVLAGLLTLILALVTLVAVIGLIKFNAPQNNPTSNVQVTRTQDQIARGEKMAYICAGCHSTTNAPPLDGGTQNFLAFGPGAGTLYPPNLTPAGPLQDWTDGEIIRAIREGVHKSGRALIIMPADQFHGLSDADVQAIVAYLRSQPAVQHSLPDNTVNLFGALLLGTGVFTSNRQPPITQPVVAPPTGTPQYGEYLVNFSGCHACHGQDLAGGTSSFVPKGPNLTVLIPNWSNADFVKTIRTGVDPTGHTLSNGMPWKQFSAAYSDAELGDIYKYLHGLTPIHK
jgi:mono/diheme cytochrome c family protein